MPYIPKIDRQPVEPISGQLAATEGQLNYQISRLIHWYLRSHGTTYTNLNAVIGVLECAKLEVARRLLAPYEERKCNENGDVYV